MPLNTLITEWRTTAASLREQLELLEEGEVVTAEAALARMREDIAAFDALVAHFESEGG